MTMTQPQKCFIRSLLRSFRVTWQEKKFKVVECEGAYWTRLALDWGQWRALVGKLRALQFIRREEFLDFIAEIH
jgi:hypothetical protein